MCENFEELSDVFAELWRHKATRLKGTGEKSVEELFERAGIYSEFGKIICISVGIIRNTTDSRIFRVKSFFGDNENKLLQNFVKMIDWFAEKNPKIRLAAHNGKEFDFPFIARRMIINNIQIPEILNTVGQKPWEVMHLDTMELWKFGDYKSYTSLKLLTAVLDIKSPKDDIEGSQVGKVYWQDKNLHRIVKYCEKDVVAIAQIMLRYKFLPLLKSNEIEYSDK